MTAEPGRKACRNNQQAQSLVYSPPKVNKIILAKASRLRPVRDKLESQDSQCDSQFRAILSRDALPVRSAGTLLGYTVKPKTPPPKGEFLVCSGRMELDGQEVVFLCKPFVG